MRITFKSSGDDLTLSILRASCSNDPTLSLVDPFDEETYYYYDGTENNRPIIDFWQTVEPSVVRFDSTFTSTGRLPDPSITEPMPLILNYLRCGWYDQQRTNGIPQWGEVYYRSTQIMQSGGGIQSDDPNFVIVQLNTPSGFFGGFGQITKASAESDPELGVVFAIKWEDFEIFLKQASNYEEKQDSNPDQAGLQYDPFAEGTGDFLGDQAKGKFNPGGDLLRFKENDSYGHHLYFLRAAGRDDLVERLFRKDDEQPVDPTDPEYSGNWFYNLVTSETTLNRYSPEQGILATHILPNEFIREGSYAGGVRTSGIVLDTTATYYASSQIATYISNEINILGTFEDSFDFNNCRVRVYLPFIGDITLSPSSIIDGSIQVVYYCDIPTGDVTAAIITRNKLGAYQLITSASGNCAYSLPVTGQGSNINELRSGLVSSIGALLQGIQKKSLADIMNSTGGFMFEPGGSPSYNIKSVGAVLGNLLGQRIFGKQYQTTTTGSTGGNVSTCDKEIKVYVEQPIPCYPKNYKDIISLPTYGGGTVEKGHAYDKISEEVVDVPYKGYAKYQFVDVNGISSATDEEKAEIQRILTEEGIYLD